MVSTRSYRKEVVSMDAAAMISIVTNPENVSIARHQYVITLTIVETKRTRSTTSARKRARISKYHPRT